VIDRLCAVAPGDQSRPRAHRDQGFGELGAVLGGDLGQRLGLGKVGGHHGGQREQPRDQDSDGGGQQQPAARTGHHDRVDHQGQIPGLQRVGHGLDQRLGEQHAGLDRVGAEVVEDGVDLRAHEGGRQLVDGGHAQSVLRGERDDGGHAVRTAAGEGLEVGLDAGAAA
jgi:hypothetical protein